MGSGSGSEDAKQIRKDRKHRQLGSVKGRCGWQPLTLVTMAFHQRLLMKADCRGIVREPQERGE